MKIVNVNRCISTEPWWSIQVESQSESGKFYNVMIPLPGDSLDDYICECPGYIHRGYCAHQEIAAMMLCGWSEQTPESEEQKEKDVCPRCGDPTIKSLEYV